jgi:hypothetical protein
MHAVNAADGGSGSRDASRTLAIERTTRGLEPHGAIVE